MTTYYDVLLFDGLMALLLICTFLFCLGLAAALVESVIPVLVNGIPWGRLTLAIRCRLRYWGLRYQEWRTRKPITSGESLWSRITALRHEHDSEHVIGGKPRW